MEDQERYGTADPNDGQIYQLRLWGRGMPDAGKRLDVELPGDSNEVCVVQGTVHQLELFVKEFKRSPGVFEAEAVKTLEAALLELEQEDAEPPEILGVRVWARGTPAEGVPVPLDVAENNKDFFTFDGTPQELREKAKELRKTDAPFEQNAALSIVEALGAYRADILAPRDSKPAFNSVEAVEGSIAEPVASLFAEAGPFRRAELERRFARGDFTSNDFAVALTAAWYYKNRAEPFSKAILFASRFVEQTPGGLRVAP